MEPVRLRRFETADAGPLAALISITLRVSNARDYPPEVIARIEKELARERLPALSASREVFVAVDADRLVGTGSLQRDWLQALFVHPRRQRQGIGRRLALHLESVARARGVDVLYLHSTLGAVGFYQLLGFEILGERANERYGRVIEMHKAIA